MTPSLPTHKSLASKFGVFRRKFALDEMPPNQALYLQGVWIAGAQAALQILVATADMSREEAIIAWKNLQDEILAAIPKAPAPEPPEEPEHLIV